MDVVADDTDERHGSDGALQDTEPAGPDARKRTPTRRRHTRRRLPDYRISVAVYRPRRSQKQKRPGQVQGVL